MKNGTIDVLLLFVTSSRNIYVLLLRLISLRIVVMFVGSRDLPENSFLLLLVISERIGLCLVTSHDH